MCGKYRRRKVSSGAPLGWGYWEVSQSCAGPHGTQVPVRPFSGSPAWVRRGTGGHGGDGQSGAPRYAWTGHGCHAGYTCSNCFGSPKLADQSGQFSPCSLATVVTISYSPDPLWKTLSRRSECHRGGIYNNLPGNLIVCFFLCCLDLSWLWAA